VAIDPLASVNELHARVRRTPALLNEVLSSGLPPRMAFDTQSSFVLTGIGTSAGVVRYAEAVLRHEGRAHVTQLPLSSFLSGDVGGQGRTLVLVSQELSPNARLALSRAHEFGRAWLLTSLSADDPRLAEFRAAGGLVWTLPPREERGFLVRVMGPPVAALALLRLAEVAGLAAVPAAVDAALARGAALASSWPAGVSRAPLVASGWYARALDLLAWTWMESLWVEAPPVWDALEVAHGALQQWSASPGPWLVLERPDEPPPLVERFLEAVGTRQPVLRLGATLPAPLAFFEHLAGVQALVVELLRRAPRDLGRWPGQGLDAPLYDLGTPVR
jgi:creatinine amidohydrolase